MPPPANAQLWSDPAVTADTEEPEAIAVTGTTLSVDVPLPSWPALLRPQHCTPPLITAQVWIVPVATAVAPLPGANTVTGIRLSTVPLLPN